MSISSSEVAEEDWTQRVRQLSPEDREQRRRTVDALLGQPDDISDPLEAELYILRGHLTGQAG